MALLCYSLIIGQYHLFLHVLKLSFPYHAQSEATQSKLQTAWVNKTTNK